MTAREPLIGVKHKDPTMKGVIDEYGVSFDMTLCRIRSEDAYRTKFVNESGAEDPRIVLAYALRDMEMSGSHVVIMHDTALDVEDFDPFLREFDDKWGKGTALIVERTRAYTGQDFRLVLVLQTPEIKASLQERRARLDHEGNMMVCRTLAAYGGIMAFLYAIRFLLTGRLW